MECRGRFGLQVGLGRTAHAGLARLEAVFHVGELHVAGLGHEALDHPVKGDIVIFAGVGDAP